MPICVGTFLLGNEHNDEFYTDENGNIRTRTNRSGGIQVAFLSCLILYRVLVIVNFFFIIKFTYLSDNLLFLFYREEMSNGETIYMRIAFKPTSTIGVRVI